MAAQGMRLEAAGLTRTFPRPDGTVLHALGPLDLMLRAGEFFSIVGPSGCGKSTLVDVMSGLAAPDAGTLLAEGVAYAGRVPEGVGLVMQEDASFPWLSVWDNVAFGLRRDGRDAAEVMRRVGHALGFMGLADFARARPSQLSGGMRQRMPRQPPGQHAGLWRRHRAAVGPAARRVHDRHAAPALTRHPVTRHPVTWRATMRGLPAWAAQAAIVLGVLLLLEALCRAGVIGRITMVPPTAMLAAAARAFADPMLREAMLVTGREVLAATTLSIAVGAALGLLLWRLPALRRVTEPVLGAWYAVPLFVFYPVMIVLFGVGEAPIIAIAFVFSLAAMVVSTTAALDRIPRALFRTARIHRLGPVQQVVHVLLPAAMPHLFAGLRLVVAYALIAAIAGEFILSSSGVGHEIAFAYDNFETAKMYGLILIVIVLATGLNGLLGAGGRRLGQGGAQRG